jgi:acyl dehydratase
MTSPAASSEPRLYFDDIRPGQHFTTDKTVTVSEAEIKAFASQFDPQPFHLDSAAGRTTVFGGLVASGWHTAALTMRLVVESGPRLAGGTVGLGAQIEWRKAVRPGDTLRIEGEVIDVTPSRSRSDRGRVRIRTETRNQHGELVQICISTVLVPCRPGAAAG